MIRKAQKKDIEAVMELVHGVIPVMQAMGNPQWDGSYPTRALYEKDIDEGTLYVCDDGGIAAVACINREQFPEYAYANWRSRGSALCVHRMAVNVNRRGQGHARALIRFAKQLAAQNGDACVRADTNSRNTPMQKLLTSEGFVFTGQISMGKPAPFYCYDYLINE